MEGVANTELEFFAAAPELLLLQATTVPALAPSSLGMTAPSEYKILCGREFRGGNTAAAAGVAVAADNDGRVC